jgi:hypothetical protein
MTTNVKSSPIDRLLAGIEGATIPDDVFSDDAILDATVPQLAVHRARWKRCAGPACWLVRRSRPILSIAANAADRR